MEENKNVKIKFSTVCVIVTILIIIIVGLLAYICYLKSNLEENEELLKYSSNIEDNVEIVESGNTEIIEDGKTASDMVEVPQLNGDFYYIDKIIKESRELDKVKNYKDFEFDLDGDGQVDKVTLRHVASEDDSEEDKYSIEYNGKPIYDEWWGLGEVGIVDLDDSDNQLEIWVYDDGPSDDPVYLFYRKVGNTIVELGGFSVDMDFAVDGKGKVLAGDRSMPRVFPRVFDCYWTIEDNKFAEHKLDFSNNPDFEYTAEGFGETENVGYFTTKLENIENFEKGLENATDVYEYYPEHGEEYNIEKLEIGEKFKISDFVPIRGEYGVYDLKVILKDGREGYLMHPYGRVSFYD